MGIEFSRDYKARGPLVSKVDLSKFRMCGETFDPYTKGKVKGSSGITRRYTSGNWTDPESLATIRADMEAGHSVLWIPDDGEIRHILPSDVWYHDQIVARHERQMKEWEELEAKIARGETIDDVLRAVEQKVAGTSEPPKPRRRRVPVDE